MYEGIQVIAEVSVSYKAGSKVQLVNSYLKLGWVILAIQQRGYDHTRIGEEAETVSIYTLGHKDAKARSPKSVLGGYEP